MVTRARDAGPLAREIEHTADVGLEVEAPTLATLFERAGLAVLEVMVDLDAVEARDRVPLGVEAEDRAALLHDWLQALLVLVQARGIVLAEVAVEEVSSTAVRGWGVGERIDRARHRLRTEVKGVSYHELAVGETAAGWQARVILDV